MHTSLLTAVGNAVLVYKMFANCGYFCMKKNVHLTHRRLYNTSDTYRVYRQLHVKTHLGMAAWMTLRKSSNTKVRIVQFYPFVCRTVSKKYR